MTHAKNHQRKWGFGLAYHISIDNNRIHQCNDLRAFTYHAKDANTYGIGIEVNRDLQKKDLTDDERNLLYAAILSVKAALPSIKHIKGHNEVTATSCPVTSMSRIRKDIEALELEIHLSQQEQPKQVAAFVAVERMNDLYKTMRANNQYSETALTYILAVEKFMRDQKILK